MIYTVKGFSVVNEAEVDVFLSKNHKAHKSWKWTTWSFTGSAVLSVACRPAALARPLKLLEHKILSLPRPTDSEFLEPRWVLLTVQFEKRWFRGPAPVILWLYLSQVQAAREDQGVWPPGAPPPPGSALSTWTPESLLPSPMQASLLGPISQPNRWSRCSCLWGRRGWPELGLMLLLEQQIPQGTKRVRARGGKSEARGRGGGWGLGQPLPRLSCLLAPNSRVQESQPARWLWGCTWQCVSLIYSF